MTGVQTCALPIYSTYRIAGFLAQAGHESVEFTVAKENLNYSADGLLAVFPKYFDKQTAVQYGRKPEKIANHVYANRMGNGPESSGDGWRFRGRGFIQVTGKNNYEILADFLDKDIDETIDYCETLDGAMESACWFWKMRNVNEYCDNDDIEGMTRAVNGGLKGLDDRTEKYEMAKQVI